MSESEILVLDEATRSKLQGLCPFSSDARSRVTPPQYCQEGIPEAIRPVFSVRPLNHQEVIRVRSLLKTVAEKKTTDDAELLEYSRKVVTGWENMYDAGNGELVIFSPAEDGNASKEIYGRLPIPIRTWLLFHAMKISGLLELEKLGLT